jgi:hypothetical protein
MKERKYSVRRINRKQNRIRGGDFQVFLCMFLSAIRLILLIDIDSCRNLSQFTEIRIADSDRYGDAAAICETTRCDTRTCDIAMMRPTIFSFLFSGV